MNESMTPKIVVGVGLVAVYTGIAFYFLRDRPVVNVAQQAVVQPATPLADVALPEPALTTEPNDLAGETATPASVVGGQPALASERPSPAASIAARTASPAPAPTPRVEPRVQQRVEPAAVAESPVVENPVLADQSTSIEDDSSNVVADATAPVQQDALPASDSQITAEVRSQIAVVAPASDIAVTTTDGVVALSGSVPSHEDVNKVLIAVQGVANVRSVEASDLMVAN